MIKPCVYVDEDTKKLIDFEAADMGRGCTRGKVVEDLVEKYLRPKYYPDE